MSKEIKFDYGKLYDNEYYKTHLGDISYDDEFWAKGFEKIADQIISRFNPKVFLDVGCAFGYLVAALRDRGVEAYGIDVSKYAISKVRDDIKPYCAVSSVTEILPKDFPIHYDLISMIEIVEHLHEEDGKNAIKNICKYSNNIIFSSSPDDEEEKTHFNVQPARYWVKLFYENGFFNDYNRKPFYISPQCLYFHKTEDIESVINDYELFFEELNKNHKNELNLICEDRRKAQIIMDSQARDLESLRNDVNVIKEDREKAQIIMDNQAEYIKHLKKDIDIIAEDREKAQEIMDNQDILIRNLKEDIGSLEKEYDKVVKSISWKITKPIRIVCSKIGRN